MAAVPADALLFFQTLPISRADRERAGPWYRAILLDGELLPVPPFDPLSCDSRFNRSFKLIAGIGSDYLDTPLARVGICLVEAELLAGKRSGDQIGNHDLPLPIIGSGKWSNEIDQPYLIPIVPLFKRQTIFRLNHASVKLSSRLWGTVGPKRQSDRLVSFPEDIELLVYQRRHYKPFEIPDRKRAMN